MKVIKITNKCSSLNANHAKAGVVWVSAGAAQGCNSQGISRAGRAPRLARKDLLEPSPCRLKAYAELLVAYTQMDKKPEKNRKTTRYDVVIPRGETENMRVVGSRMQENPSVNYHTIMQCLLWCACK